MAEEARCFEETLLVQYRDFEHDHEFSDTALVAQKLAEWLADPKRSPHFNVRVRRRPIKEKP